jgi:hypothetical protein
LGRSNESVNMLNPQSAVMMALMIAGFVDTQVDASETSYPGLSNATLFTSKKQAIEKSASVAISLNNGTAKASTGQPLKKWTVLADDFDGEEDEDMIDEVCRRGRVAPTRVDGSCGLLHHRTNCWTTRTRCSKRPKTIAKSARMASGERARTARAGA